MMLAIFLAIEVILIIIMALTPYITRKTELFGVSIPAKESRNSHLKQMRKSYLNVSCVIGAIMLLLQSSMRRLNFSEKEQTMIFMIIIFLYLAVMFFVYYNYHKKMRAYKATQLWQNAGKEDGESILVIDTEPMKDEIVSPFWILLYPLIALVTAMVVFMNWAEIPDRFPMNFDFAGNVTNWAEKSMGSVIAMLAAQWAILIIFIVVYFIIGKSKRQIDASTPDVSREQGRRFRYIMSASMIFGGAALAIIMGMMFVSMLLYVDSMIPIYISIILILLLVVFMIILSIVVGQGGSRLKVNNEKHSDTYNVDDDKYWKLGVFYFNRNDPSLFVEKRFGVGYTNNFARPLSWMILVGIFAIVGLLILITTMFA